MLFKSKISTKRWFRKSIAPSVSLPLSQPWVGSSAVAPGLLRWCKRTRVCSWLPFSVRGADSACVPAVALDRPQSASPSFSGCMHSIVPTACLRISRVWIAQQFAWQFAGPCRWTPCEGRRQGACSLRVGGLVFRVRPGGLAGWRAVKVTLAGSGVVGLWGLLLGGEKRHQGERPRAKSNVWLRLWSSGHGFRLLFCSVPAVLPRTLCAWE